MDLSELPGIDNNNNLSNWDNTGIIPSVRSLEDETPIEELYQNLERERETMQSVFEECNDNEDKDSDDIIKNIKTSEIQKFLYKYKNIKQLILNKRTRISKIEKDIKLLNSLISEYEGIMKKLNTNFLLDSEIKEAEIEMTKLLKAKFLRIKIKNNNEIIKTKEKLNTYESVLEKLQEIIKESATPDENFICKICYTNECTHVLVPCGHLICEECKYGLENPSRPNRSPIRNNLLTHSSLFMNMIGEMGLGSSLSQDSPSIVPTTILMPRRRLRSRGISPLIEEISTRRRSKCHICRVEYTNMIKMFKN